MSTRPRIVLASVLAVLRPLVRLLVRHGVTYPAVAAALKRVFLDAARAELRARGMAQTDSAVTLLSGVHRRDVRQLGRGTPPQPERQVDEPLGQAAQVVARWMSDPACLDAGGAARPLQRPEFDALVAAISSDVRPRAMLDELLRLQVVHEAELGIALVDDGFAPRHGFDETAALFADNLRDHAAAAVANLEGERDLLEQAVFVDQISEASARRLHEVAVRAWKQAFATVMREAQQRFDADAALPAAQRSHRARFGVYFFSDREDAS